MRIRVIAALLAALLASCSPSPDKVPVMGAAPAEQAPEPSPSIEPELPAEPDEPDASAPPLWVEPTPLPTLAPTPVPEKAKPLLAAAPPPFSLTPAGLDLIEEFEVGGRSGYSPFPEAPDRRVSGVTIGLGYDLHYNKPVIILEDWSAIEQRARLAAMNPYYGVSAQAHLHEVRDILISWAIASDVFNRIDVGREFANAKRYVSGFEELRPNAQAAIISLGFNRGWSFTGPNRTEMRAIRDAAPGANYGTMAQQFRKMVRVWKGTSIERGMTRRRYAEAKLVETP